MQKKLNADEVLEMALQMERNGQAFYKRAAEGQDDPQIKKELLELVQMEKNHEKIFEVMRNNFSASAQAPEFFDPENEGARYLHAMVEGKVFNTQANSNDILDGKEALPDVLKMAIGAEKDSIVFYLGIQDSMRSEDDKYKVGEIIREEMGHVILLSQKLAAAERIV